MREDDQESQDPEPPSREEGPVGCARRRGRPRLGTLAVIAVVLAATSTPAQESEARSRSAVVPPEAAGLRRETDLVAREAFAYFASVRRADGSLGGRYAVATTSLVGLSILGAGVPPQRDGDPGATVLEGCVSYILALARRDPFITEPGADDASGSRMHGHCYAILFLTQVAGALPEAREEQVATAVRRGVRVIERAQSRRGGWYYWADNRTHQDEASVTVCALQALRAARNTGFVVDGSRIEAAVRYLKASQDPRTGGVYYSLSQANTKTTYSLTAAAVSTWNAAGVYESEELRKGLAFLDRELARPANRRRPADAVHPNYFFYGNLYAAQAFFQDGGARWDEWYPAVRKQLLRRREGGHWQSPYGDEYATAVALLILEMPLGYLPIFQR